MPDHWLNVREGVAHLKLGWSPTSHRYHFPPSTVCPYAGTNDVVDVELSGSGALFGWTSVTSPPPGYDGPVPYGLGVVEFDGYGFRLVGRITEADSGALRAGQTMELVTEGLPNGMWVWAFAPADGQPDAVVTDLDTEPGP